MNANELKGHSKLMEIAKTSLAIRGCFAQRYHVKPFILDNELEGLSKLMEIAKTCLAIRGCFSYRYHKKSFILDTVRLLILSSFPHHEDGEILLYFYNYRHHPQVPAEIASSLYHRYHPYSQSFDEWCQEILNWEYTDITKVYFVNSWLLSHDPIYFFRQRPDAKVEPEDPKGKVLCMSQHADPASYLAIIHTALAYGMICQEKIVSSDVNIARQKLLYRFKAYLDSQVKKDSLY